MSHLYFEPFKKTNIYQDRLGTNIGKTQKKDRCSSGNTDGFDPDSCTDVRLHDSIIDTGDDGISIKSGNASAEEMAARAGRNIPGTKQTIQRPAKDIHIYRTKVLSRNFCLGSATYGGIFNLLMEDCELGDDEGSMPWAIKYKSHQNYAGALVNHT